MTFNLYSILVLALCLTGMFLGWRLSIYLGRLLILCWRLSVSVACGVGLIYLFYCSWPYLLDLQARGWFYLPRIPEWTVVIQ